MMMYMTIVSLLEYKTFKHCIDIDNKSEPSIISLSIHQELWSKGCDENLSPANLGNTRNLQI